LDASSELDLVAQRHTAYFLSFAEPLGREASVGEALRDTATDAIMADYRNLLVVLRWALDKQEAELALRLAWTLEFVWKWCLPIGEGRPWVEEVLTLPGAATPTPGRAVSLLTAALLAWGRGDYVAADGYYAEADPLARTLGDPWILFAAQVDQGNAAQQRGDYAAARHFWQEGLVTARASQMRACEAALLTNLGRLEAYERNYAVGGAQCDEALALARETGDVWAVWQALNALALAALVQDDLASARSLAYEGLNLKVDPTWQVRELFVLGQIAIAEGEYTAARGHLIHALALLENRDDPVATALIVETVGKLAGHTGQPEVALRLAAAADGARDVADAAVSRSLASVAHSTLPWRRQQRRRTPVKGVRSGARTFGAEPSGGPPRRAVETRSRAEAGGWLLVEHVDNPHLRARGSRLPPERMRIYAAVWSADLRFLAEHGVRLDRGRRLFGMCRMQGHTDLTADEYTSLAPAAPPTRGSCILGGCRSARHTPRWG
jgi:tetratricopeptide (TPR) repeat protein